MGVREMHCNRWSRVAAFIFAILLTAVSARSAPSPASLLHSNVAPRRDVSGSIMDAHDGSYRFFTAAGGTGKWYYYAMGYGLCKEDGVSCQAARCGTTWNNTVGLWTSPDLATWTQEVENVLPYDQRPNCTYYRWVGFEAPWPRHCALCAALPVH